MALAARHIPLTREDVHLWLVEHSKQEGDQVTAVEVFLDAKLKDRGLDSTMVDTSEHTDLDEETPLLNMILMDLDSYASS